MLENLYIYINATYIFCIEIIITLIYAIIQYIKFRKIDIYTDKAILNKQKLKELSEFLKDNSLIQDRRALEIYIWEDYLTFSVLLGINNNIPDEIKINLSNIEKKEAYIIIITIIDLEILKEQLLEQSYDLTKK